MKPISLDNLLALFCAACIVTFVLRLPVYCRPRTFTFTYQADTAYRNSDHTYRFTVIRRKNGYLCFVDRAPYIPDGRLWRRLADLVEDSPTGRRRIHWESPITEPEQARELCRRWADKCQFHIDAGYMGDA